MQHFKQIFSENISCEDHHTNLLLLLLLLLLSSLSVMMDYQNRVTSTVMSVYEGQRAADDLSIWHKSVAEI